MRGILVFILACLAFSGVAYAQDKPPRDEQFLEQTQDYILQQAALNLQANKKLYVQMLAHVDGASGLSWIKHLGQAIPAQPVAAIEILTLSGYDIEGVCPAFFPEDAPDSIIDAWTANAVEALSAFKMAEPEQEAVRQKCLENIIRVDKAYKQKLTNQ